MVNTLPSLRENLTQQTPGCSTVDRRSGSDIDIRVEVRRQPDHHSANIELSPVHLVSDQHRCVGVLLREIRIAMRVNERTVGIPFSTLWRLHL
jgi:hypothetical protein